MWGRGLCLIFVAKPLSPIMALGVILHHDVIPRGILSQKPSKAIESSQVAIRRSSTAFVLCYRTNETLNHVVLKGKTTSLPPLLQIMEFVHLLKAANYPPLPLFQRESSLSKVGKEIFGSVLK